MPFIPHSEEKVREILSAIGVNSVEDLLDELPDNFRCGNLEAIPAGMSEKEVSRPMVARARSDGEPSCFIGAG
jgi:glycine dehydrogenase subunit 1